MRRYLLTAAGLVALFSPAKAADSTVAAMSAASALSGTELLYTVQGGADRKATPAQINTYVLSLMGTGVATWLATPSSANLAAAVTGETGTGALVFATSPTLVTPALGTPASGTLTNTTGFPVANLAGAGTGVLAAASATLNSSTGLVGALTPTNGNCVTGNGTAWTSATCATGTATAVPSDQTGTNYAFQGTDLTKIIYLSNAANQVPTIAQAGTGSFTNGWYTTACNIGAGTQTITPATSTIGGAATYVLPAGSAAAPKCIGIASDGTNYRIVPDYFRFGTGAETAAGTAVSTAGGFPVLIAAGTSALGTSAITSGSCASVVTTTATGAATTDVISWTPNADISAVTGYAPVTTGGLIIYPYPTSGNVNWKVCNPTSSSITPGAVTLNWRITR